MKDLTIANKGFYDWIKSGPKGATTRALLGAALAGGDGAASVIRYRMLSRDTGPKTTLPPCPLLAWRPGQVRGQNGGMRSFDGTWHIFDEPGQGEGRLYGILEQLQIAHSDALDIIPFGRVTVGFIGQPELDRKLNLYGLPVQLIFSRR